MVGNNLCDSGGGGIEDGMSLSTSDKGTSITVFL